MKKVLLAASLVAVSATGALAQNITLSGDGRMGVALRPGTNDAPAAQRNFVDGRIRFNINASREGDNGLAFGGTLRIGQSFSNGGSSAIGPRNGAIFIEGGGLRVTMGDINGAVAHRVAIFGGGLGFTGGVARPATHITGDARGRGLLEDDNGRTGVRADFAAEGFLASVSYRPTIAGSGEVAVGYSMSGLTVALGYYQGRSATVLNEPGSSIHLSATYTFGDITVGGLVSQRGLPIENPGDARVNRTSWRVWGTYDLGDIRLGLTHTVGDEAVATGVGVRYSLGGGAFLHGAVETRRARFVVAPNTTRPARTGGEIGVTFTF